MRIGRDNGAITLLTWLFAALLSLGHCACLQSGTFFCGDRLCPADTTCSIVHNTCLRDDQIAACEEVEDGDRCNYPGVDDGTCVDGACFPTFCGNDNVDFGEVCDDGNSDSGDGCSSDCRSDETCGNGITDPLAGETCDDGKNSRTNDGCDDDCALEQPQWFAETSPTPPARSDHAMAYDAAHGRLVVFGGNCLAPPNGCRLEDTWTFDGETWEQLHTTNTPGSRASQMTYDSKRNRMVLFGGRAQGGVATSGNLNDTWTFDGHSWHHVTTGMPVPARRADHALAYDSARDRVVLFGGQGALLNQLTDNATWEFDGSKWTELVQPVNPPAARRHHAMAYDPVRGVVVMFGGSDKDDELLDDTWEFDGSSWQKITEGSPSARAGHAMVFDPTRGQVLLSGGSDGSYLGDTYAWNGSEWTDVTVTASPPARSGHGLAYDILRRRTVLFGGTDDPGGPLNQAFDDIWDLDATTWSLRDPPPPINQKLFGHSMAYDSERGVIVMFGGKSSTMTVGPGSNVTYEYDGSRWRELDLDEPIPPGRYKQASAYDPVERVTIIAGGDGGGFSGNLDDTWQFDGLAWSQASGGFGPLTSPQMSSLPPSGALMCGAEDTLLWDGEAWTSLGTSLEAGGHAMTYDSIRRRAIVAGGSLPSTFEWVDGAWQDVEPEETGPSNSQAAFAFDGTRGRAVWFGGGAGTMPTNETWEYDGSAWNQISYFDSPPGLNQHAMAYHAARRKMVVYGGWLTGGITSSKSWVFRYRANGPEESCNTGHDGDGDGLIGCDDLDCWGWCRPHCPPGAENCDESLPHCGDGQCVPVESARLCPEDCGAPAQLCGDYFCEGDEDELSCPGDCPP